MTSGADRPRFGAVTHAFRDALWAERWRFGQAAAITATAVAANALAPWPLKWIIDGLLGETQPGPWTTAVAHAGIDGAIVGLGALFLGFALTSALAESSDGVVTARIRERLSAAVRDRMLVHLQTLPPTVRTRYRSGELVLRLVGDVDQLARLWTKTLPLVVRFVATMTVTIVGLVWLSPVIGLVCALLLPVLWALVHTYGARVTETSRAKRRRDGDVAGVAQEIVRGLPVLQAIGATDTARRRFADVNREGLRAGVEAARAAARLERSFEIARALVTAGVTVGGALLVVRGRLTVGALTVLGAYVAQLVRPIDKVNDLTESVTKGLVAGERLARLLAEPALVADAPSARDLDRATGHVRLESVWFGYGEAGDARPAVLRGVSFTLEPDRLTVLTGPSGAGKSTLVALLLRLFDPSSGTITLDGQPLDAYTLRSLRRQFAVMTQDLHLFAGTLRQALTMEATSPDDTALWSALASVALDGFVRGLPSGLDTPLGEDGANLSGGQRQRLSLARAFLLDRPVLILDEPLANVDADSARIIRAAIRRLRAGRTCLAITHESSLVAEADVVLHLDQGAVSVRQVPPFHAALTLVPALEPAR